MEVSAEVQAIVDKRAAKGEVMVGKMKQFVGMADGHATSGPNQLWLYFHEFSKMEAAAKAFKAAGHRKLEAFQSPEGSGQLSYTLIADFYHKVNDSKMYDNQLSKIVGGMGVNPVFVMYLYDGTFIVGIDEQSDLKKWAMFVALHAKAMKSEGRDGTVVKRSHHAGEKAIELVKEYTVSFNAKQ